MIISHRLGFAFFRVPKTGSSTAEMMLRMCGSLNDEDLMTVGPMLCLPACGLPDDLAGLGHMTPQESYDAGLITLEQLVEYDCYVFTRDEVERRRSERDHAVGRGVISGSLGLRPQADYLTVNTVAVVEELDFDKYESELRRMIDKINGMSFPVIPRLRAGVIGSHSRST